MEKKQLGMRQQILNLEGRIRKYKQLVKLYKLKCGYREGCSAHEEVCNQIDKLEYELKPR